MLPFNVLGKIKTKQVTGLNLLLFFCGSLLIITGTVTLSGWISGVRLMVNMMPQYIPMSPVNSLFFIVFGLFLFETNNLNRKMYRVYILIIVSLFSIYGLLQFAGYFLNQDLTFENTLFPVTERLGNFPLRHMSPYSGLLFFISGIAVILKILSRESSLVRNLAGGIGSLVALAGFVAALGYLYGTPFLYSGNIIPLALRTAICFFVLGFGLLFMSGKNTVFLRILIGPTVSAKLLRVTIPTVVSIFMLYGVLDVILTHYLNVEEALLLALLSIFSVILVIVVIINLTSRIFQSANKAEMDRFKVLEELKEVNTLQTLILDNSTMGIYMVRNRVFQWTNKRMEEIFQIPLKNINGASTRLIFPSDEIFEKQAMWYDYLGRGKIVDTPIQLKHPNGDLFWCRFIGSALDPDNPNEGSVWMVEDITERRKLRDRMRLLSHTIECLAECVSITDTTDRIIFLNEAFQKTYGYTQEELLGRNISVVSSDNNDKQLVKSIMPATLNGGWQGELLNRKKDGTEFPAYIATSRVLDENGEVVALVGVATDITELRKTELQLKKYSEELKTANDAKDKLFSVISHDLRSLFNSILGFFRLLNEQYDDFTEEEKKSFILNMKNSSENTFELLENLLTWSRTQTGGIKVTATKIDLAEVVSQQVAILRDTANSKKITLTGCIPDGTMIYADRDMVKTILLNLTGNAIKFTGSAGNIAITSIIKNSEVLITVADNGVGIGSSEIANIFKLGKSHPTLGTSNEKGTGLGLLICKEFTELNSGRIWVESEQGIGSKFIFTLPVYSNT